MKDHSTLAHWTDTLFVRHAELYLPLLQSEDSYASEDIQSLQQIFDEFNVPVGSKILDLKCGIGRHCIRLAELGYEVVGYDLSSFFLQEANFNEKKSQRHPHGIRFYQGEASVAGEFLAIKGEKNFDAAIIMSNSIGYGTEEYDILTLRSVLQAAARNCIIVIETENRDWRIRNFQPYVNSRFDDLELLQQWKFDILTSAAEGNMRFYRNSLGKDLQLLLNIDLTLRLYSLHELKRLLEMSGWTYLKSYGTLRTLESPSYDAEHLVTIGRKVE